MHPTSYDALTCSQQGRMSGDTGGNVRHIYSQLYAGEIRNHKVIPLLFLCTRFSRDNRSLQRLQHILRDLPGTPREQDFL